jgi:hypothetical protein
MVEINLSDVGLTWMKSKILGCKISGDAMSVQLSEEGDGR